MTITNQNTTISTTTLTVRKRGGKYHCTFSYWRKVNICAKTTTSIWGDTPEEVERKTIKFLNQQ